MHQKVKDIYLNLMKDKDPNKFEIVFEWPGICIYTTTPPNVKTYTTEQYVNKLLKELIDDSRS